MSVDSETAARLATLTALGLDADTVVFPIAPRDELAAPTTTDGLASLSEEEWGKLQRHLPDEAPQDIAMSNRAFVDAVLWVFAHGKAWTQVPGEAGEAVRRRFARWAHAGHWQTLFVAACTQGLAAIRETQFAAIARRAARLRARKGARPSLT